MPKPIDVGSLVKFKNDYNVRCGYGIVVVSGGFNSEVYWLSDSKTETTFTMVLEDVKRIDLPEL